MYSPLRCCSGYLDYTLHAVLLLNENYDIGQRSNVLLYIGEKSKKKKKKKKRKEERKELIKRLIAESKVIRLQIVLRYF